MTVTRVRRGIIFQKRDHELLWQLFLMRLAVRDQLMTAAGFKSVTRINTRLLALYRAGLLRRFFIGFGAGRKAIYALSRKGAQLIGVNVHGPRHRQNVTLASVVCKSVVGGAVAAVPAVATVFLLPIAFAPELISLPIAVAVGLFTYFNHRRHHLDHDRYLAQENTHFAVIPDAPRAQELHAPAPRLLTKGDPQ